MATSNDFEVAPVGTIAKLAALSEAAKAVVARWDSPKWKDEKPTAEYIGRLRAALEMAP